MSKKIGIYSYHPKNKLKKNESMGINDFLLVRNIITNQPKLDMFIWTDIDVTYTSILQPGSIGKPR